MWNKIAELIIRNRLFWIGLIIVSTIYMGYQASRIQLSYEFARILPANDPIEQEYQRFRKLFGEDGSLMVIGYQSSEMYKLDNFNDWYDLSQAIKKHEGIKNVISLTNLIDLKVNETTKRFDVKPLLTQKPKSQAEVDSIKDKIANLKFYEGMVVNSKTNTTLMAITFNEKDLNSKKRISIVQEIRDLAHQFELKHKTTLHFSGMPFIRTATMQKVSHEMELFMGLAVLVTAAILWFFFRSVRFTLVSILVVLIGVVFSVGTLVMMGYKITMLTGLIPPLLIVIGVPNCIFLINRYQAELLAHGDKQLAIRNMITGIGLSTFLANMTTAIGFGVFYFTNSSLLVEFGVVSALNVMVTYVLCLVLVPISVYYMGLPQVKHLKHLDGQWAKKFLSWIDHTVHNNRPAIYLTALVVVLVSAYGVTKINVIGYVVDDLPKKDPIYTDLRFFEENFNGVLPFEIMIDTKRKNGVFDNQAEALYKIKSLQNRLKQYKEFSKPLSIVEAVRFLYQSYKGGEARYFIMPSVFELSKLSEYLQTDSSSASKQIKPFLNDDKSITRISYQMADVGSVRIKELMKEIQPQVDEIFPKDQYKVSLTGHSLVFLKSNDYLLGNLYESLLIAIVLIALVGMVLFRSIPIIILSKLPCLIPLALTAGIMGFFDIHFKPSTILIFSITFGIASDGTVYFLTRYRQELEDKGNSVRESITNTIFGTGLSMIYTAIILFCGFSIFAASSFGGTAAMGVMVSITLLIAMCTNLILLPALLLTINRKKLDVRKTKAVVLEEQ
ncbi:RND family transporter [Cellulophaga sp. BC115SP]|uniref:efflux RND transporter permease subunit n=1 Tax=Cellulophaga sp. BC115SP TaxID=2683263 RepID=UPI0014122432|nr:MMPL family transporter [Cellulophaga sp. BC115SP]NBB29006.1 MMPL family transporter [Cellulophaga sp. BC115SP]